MLEDDQLPSADQDEERSLDMGDLPDGDGDADPTTAPVPEKVRARDETRRDDATPGRANENASGTRMRTRLFISSAGSFVRWFVGDAMRIH